MQGPKAGLESDRRSLLLAGAAAAAGIALPAVAAAATKAAGTASPINVNKSIVVPRVGTIREPNYYDRLDWREGDVGLKHKGYTYTGSKGVVIGIVTSVVFTIDRPAKDVWPHLKDFNSFEGPDIGIRYTNMDDELVAWGDLYSDVDHDLGKELMCYGGPKGTFKSVPSRVIRCIPEHLLVIWETIPSDGSSNGLSPGYHTINLNEHVGKSHISMILEHAERGNYKTEEEALRKSMWGPTQYDYIGLLNIWKDKFIPKLKELSHQAPRKA